MAMFNVTYEIVTEESAEHGESEEQGFILEDATLRDAIQAVYQTRTNRVDGVMAVETDQSPVNDPRWITVYNGMEYETGAREARSLHIPDNTTRSSRLRIARLLGIRC